MSADGLPHQRTVILIRGLHLPVSRGILNAADVPEEEHGPGGRAVIRVRKDLVPHDVNRIAAALYQRRESVEQRAELRAKVVLGALEICIGNVRRQSLPCRQHPRKLKEGLRGGSRLIV